MTRFGERLRQARRDARMSQTQLAGDELSASYVSLLESGKRQPSTEVTRMLAKRLGCSVESLLGEHSDGDRRITELELAYAKLAINHGQAGSAQVRLQTLLSNPALDQVHTDEAISLLAHAEERLNNLQGAANLLLPVFERCLKGLSSLPLAPIALDLCGFYLDSGDVHAAVRVGERGLDAVHALGLEGTDEHLRLAATLMWAYFELGDFAHCASWASSLITLAEERGSPRGQAAIYWNAAHVAEAQGRLSEALHLSNRALALFGELGTERDLPRLRVEAAWFLLRCTPPRPEQAAQVLDAAFDELRDLGSHVDLAVWESVRALADLLMGRPLSAERLAREALLHLASHPGIESVKALVTLGDAVVAQGRQDEALDHYLAAREVLTSLFQSRRTAALLREVGLRLELVGDTRDALQTYPACRFKSRAWRPAPAPRSGTAPSHSGAHRSHPAMPRRARSKRDASGARARTGPGTARRTGKAHQRRRRRSRADTRNPHPQPDTGRRARRDHDRRYPPSDTGSQDRSTLPYRQGP
jgi:transcriptional regulator with XRE-family HTH domain